MSRQTKSGENSLAGLKIYRNILMKLISVFSEINQI